MQIWCQPLLGDLCPLWSEQKCVSWLTTGWGTWLHRRHLVLSNRGDSLLGSLWKLTAKHSQLDLRYLERLSFSPWIKGGLHKTCTRLQQINVSLVACQHASPSKIRTIKHIACKLWRWLKLYICEHIWDTFNYKFGITRKGEVMVMLCFCKVPKKLNRIQSFNLVFCFLLFFSSYNLVRRQKFSQVLQLLFQMCNRELRICIISFHSQAKDRALSLIHCLNFPFLRSLQRAKALEWGGGSKLYVQEYTVEVAKGRVSRKSTLSLKKMSWER